MDIDPVCSTLVHTSGSVVATLSAKDRHAPDRATYSESSDSSEDSEDSEDSNALSESELDSESGDDSSEPTAIDSNLKIWAIR